MANPLDHKNTKPPESSDNRGQKNEPAPAVLIVDDDGDSRSMLKILLEMWKYKTVEATDGIEAVKLTQKFCPDLILMDVKLPHLDGFDVTRQIRQSKPFENIPIVFLSAYADAPSKQKGYAAGGNEYLTKPLDFEELENTLFKYVRRTWEESI